MSASLQIIGAVVINFNRNLRPWPWLETDARPSWLLRESWLRALCWSMSVYSAVADARLVKSLLVTASDFFVSLPGSWVAWERFGLTRTRVMVLHESSSIFKELAE